MQGSVNSVPLLHWVGLYHCNIFLRLPQHCPCLHLPACLSLEVILLGYYNIFFPLRRLVYYNLHAHIYTSLQDGGCEHEDQGGGGEGTRHHSLLRGRAGADTLQGRGVEQKHQYINNGGGNRA